MSLLHIAGGATEDKLYVEDVFSTYLYTGNGSTQTITNGIDLAGKGGMVWTKARNIVLSHYLVDSSRGISGSIPILSTNTTGASVTGVWEYNPLSTGYSFNTNGSSINGIGNIYASWTFRKAPKFYTQTLKVHTTGTPSTVDLSTLGVVGMVTVKATIGSSNWFAWHKDLTAGNNLKLNLTDAQSITNAYLSVSGTTLTISGSAPSDTYIVFALAHDPSADGIIQCGSFTHVYGIKEVIDLGFEPQYILSKNTTTASNWQVFDNLRGITSTESPHIVANESATEQAGSFINLQSNGFSIANATMQAGAYIYLAIRRPMKVPTSGTEVYNAIARTGTGAAATVNGAGFAPDLAIIDAKNRTDFHIGFYDRLRGKGATLYSPLADAEINNTNALGGFDVSDGYRTSIGGAVNMSGALYINHFFKRAKGFFDNFCWTGTGVNRTIAHNLGVAPELLILKSRSATGYWQVWFSGLASNEKLVLNSTAAKVTDATLLNSTLPTSALISLGTQAAVNTSSATYVGYAFASLDGVQKIGTYVGNGTTQNLNFGFSAGVRFFLCKAVTTTGSYWVFDSVRGIVASTDFGLQLNSTAAEVTSADCVDPFVGGISVVEEATCHLNTNGVTYMYWAIA